MDRIELRPFTEKEYHAFFRRYRSDPITDPTPFVYNREQISRSYTYNYGGFRENYVHLGIFIRNDPVGAFQLKRMDPEKKQCEFGIILRDDSVKNRGIGTEAIRTGISLAHSRYHMNRIIGDTMGHNKRMIHIFEKLGFTLSETVPGAFELPDGMKDDRLIFILDLSEYD